MNRILVVDDCESSRFLLRSILEEAGYSVLEAACGSDALGALQRSKADLVILDIRMPPPDGYEVLRQIRRNSALESLPVIALTAEAMQGERERALSSGFTGYLPKPASPKAVRTEVERLLLAPTC